VNWAALLIGLLIVGGTIRTLVVGGASADGQGLRRDDTPEVYWAIILAGALAGGFLIYEGLLG
jgi:hypothetical protein